MAIESWMVTAVILALFALVMLVVGLLGRVCRSLCEKLANCSERGDWPCRS
jgi:hypothetical protein